MPPVLIAVAAGGAAAFFGAGLVLAGAIGIGAAAAVKYLGDALTPDYDLGAVNPAADQQIVTSANQPRKIIYGEAVIGGQIIGYANPTIGDKKYHIFAIHLAGHHCDAVEIYQIEGIPLAELGGYVTAQYHLGTQTTANTLANTYIDGWTNDHIGFDLTNAYLKIEENAEKFPQGIKEIKFKVRGKPLYDPRLDTTAGGSGSHRLNDQTSWEWSDNSILCSYDWVMNYGYRPIPTRRIPWNFVALAANHCDESASYTDASGNPQTEKRFTCNGALNNAMRPGDGLKYILDTMGATPYRPSGRIYIKPAMYGGPATVSLTPADFIEQPTYQPHRPERERCNLVRGEYVACDRNYQQTDCPVVENKALQAADKDGAILEANLKLLLVNRSTNAQRLLNLHLQRNRAGFIGEATLKGIRLDAVPGSVVQFDDAETGISREFIVQNPRFDVTNKQTLISLEEENPLIYPDDFTAVEVPAPANAALPDTTTIDQPTTLAFTATPADSFRQGFLSWSHPVPAAVRRYIALITKNPADDFYQSGYPIAQELDISTLPAGSYIAAISAENRFERRSVGTALVFNVGLPTTPTTALKKDVLPGRVHVVGPDLPNSAATYQWRYLFSDDFANSIQLNNGNAVTVTETPQNGTLYLWYRITEVDLVDPNWVQVVIPNLIGLDSTVVTPELIAGITLPGLPQSMLDTISGITNDIDLVNELAGKSNDEIDFLFTRYIGSYAANAASSLEILRVESKVGDKSVSAQITEFKEVGFGYEDEAGDWIEGALYARAFNELRLVNADDESISVYSFFQALETKTGELEGRIHFAIDVAGRLTGMFIEGSETSSNITMATENFKIVDLMGNVYLGLNTSTGIFEFYGAGEFYGKVSAPIYEMVGTGSNDFTEYKSSTPFGPDSLVLWRGPKIVGGDGKANPSAMTIANSYQCITATNEFFDGGDRTIRGLLTASALAPSSAVLLTAARRLAPIAVNDFAFTNSSVRENRNLLPPKLVGPQYGAEYEFHPNRAANYKVDVLIEILCSTDSSQQEKTTVDLYVTYETVNPADYYHNNELLIYSTTLNDDEIVDYGSVPLMYRYTTVAIAWQTLQIKVVATAVTAAGRPLSISAKYTFFNGPESIRAPHTITTDNNSTPTNSTVYPSDTNRYPYSYIP